MLRKPDGSIGDAYVLSVIDCFTNYVLAIPIANKESLTIARALYLHLILVHGPPDAISSDRGGEFVSEVMRAMNAWQSTSYHVTTAYHPQSNGKVEQWHRVLLRIVKTYLESLDKDSNWSDL